MKLFTTVSLISLIGLVSCSIIPYMPIVNDMCDIHISKIGCSSKVGGEYLEDMLVSDREDNSEHKIDWKQFPASTSSLLCRCSRVAQEKGYIVFGIQYFGECWGSKKTLSSIIYNLKLSDDCRNVYFNACNTFDTPLCVGRSESTYLYTLTSAKLPVDGGYSEWSNWSPCSTTCGAGAQERSRQCDNPKPENGGIKCYHLGNSEETRTCLTTAQCENTEPFISTSTCQITKGEEFSIITSSSNFTPTTPFCAIFDTRSKWVGNEHSTLASYKITSSLWNNKESSASFGLAYNAKDLRNYEFVYIRTVSQGDMNPFCSQAGEVIDGKIKWSGTDSCIQPLLSKRWIHLTVEVTSKVVKFTADGQLIVDKTPSLPIQSIGGLVVKNGLGSEVFFQNIMIEQVISKT